MVKTASILGCIVFDAIAKPQYVRKTRRWSVKMEKQKYSLTQQTISIKSYQKQKILTPPPHVGLFEGGGLFRKISF